MPARLLAPLAALAVAKAVAGFLTSYLAGKAADELYEDFFNRSEENIYRDNAVLAKETFERLQKRRKNIFGTEQTITTYIDKALTSAAFGPSGRENRNNYIPTAISKVDAERSFVQYGSMAKSEGYSGRKAVDVVARATNTAIDLMSYAGSKSINEPNQAIEEALKNNFRPLSQMGVVLNRELVNQQFKKYPKQGRTGGKYRLQALLDAIEKNVPKVKGHYKRNHYASGEYSSYYKQNRAYVEQSNYSLASGTKGAGEIENHYKKKANNFQIKNRNLKNMSEEKLQHIFNFDPSKWDTLFYRLTSFLDTNDDIGFYTVVGINDNSVKHVTEHMYP